jgi:hypothetical protein
LHAIAELVHDLAETLRGTFQLIVFLLYTPTALLSDLIFIPPALLAIIVDKQVIHDEQESLDEQETPWEQEFPDEHGIQRGWLT